ncbi:MAG: hypothetical protein ABI723_16070 [Bacteroidia bacterium]
MIVSEIALFNTLKIKLGEQDAQTIVEGIKQTVKAEFENKKEVLATKQDVTEAKLDMVKWMVGFWIVQMAAIIGLYLKS